MLNIAVVPHRGTPLSPRARAPATTLWPGRAGGAVRRLPAPGRDGLNLRAV